jgi:hypothetical protein
VYVLANVYLAISSPSPHQEKEGEKWGWISGRNRTTDNNAAVQQLLLKSNTCLALRGQLEGLSTSNRNNFPDT